MHIAIQASDLDHTRIDGTRVYLKELLKRFGRLEPKRQFLLYHQHDFNPLLTPGSHHNYKEVKIPFSWAWMQTRFSWQMFRDRPDKLFLPIQAAPVFLPRDIEVTATIHDLAWKKYPETFGVKTRMKLDFLLKTAVNRADKLIAVSQSTKNDLLASFPGLSEKRIHVIHHGFDPGFWNKKISDPDLGRFLESYKLQARSYILYVGALQPRKNLVRLIAAFEKAKRECPEMKLVLVGEPAWLSEKILEAAKKSAFRKDIILAGRATFEDLRTWYRGARLFAFPSLYEGFGIPILEAFASEIPVLTARNSSLTEVADEAALYVDAENADDIAEKLLLLWQNESLRTDLVSRGQERLYFFSWDRCAKETLGYLLDKS